LLKQGLFAEFYALWPHKFNNKTNGVTPRRWLANCNPDLRELITGTIGEGWIRDLSQLEQLVPYADDAAFCERFMDMKYANKQALAKLVAKKTGIEFDPAWMFDVQVKRIHEYKRQLLNILHVISLYDRIRKGDTDNMTPRCVLIGGKAAPGYAMAKLIIKLINNVAHAIAQDEQASQWLKVAFLPNYNVSAMEIICPGTDLSEQISTAGKEASGTGNMKFMMNGALTIGTLDGANIEIREAVGADNFFLFGLEAHEVAETRQNYNPQRYIDADPNLQAVINLLQSGHFSLFEPGIFDPIVAALTASTDPWMTAADFSDYCMAQEQAACTYKDKTRWARMAVLNTATSGRFSSDRTIAEYRDDIWYRAPEAVRKVS
jgi:starch phosphorylase